MSVFIGLSAFYGLPSAVKAGTSTKNLTDLSTPGSKPFTYVNLSGVHYQLEFTLKFDAHPSSFELGILRDSINTTPSPPAPYVLPTFDPGFVDGVDGTYSITLNPSNFYDPSTYASLVNTLFDSHGSFTTGSATLTLTHNAQAKQIDYFGTVTNTTVPNCPPGSTGCGLITGTSDFSFVVNEGNVSIVNRMVGYGVASVTENEVPGPLPILGVGAAFGYSRKLRKRIKSSKLPEVMSAI